VIDSMQSHMEVEHDVHKGGVTAGFDFWQNLFNSNKLSRVSIRGGFSVNNLWSSQIHHSCDHGLKIELVDMSKLGRSCDAAAFMVQFQLLSCNIFCIISYKDRSVAWLSFFYKNNLRLQNFGTQRSCGSGCLNQTVPLNWKSSKHLLKKPPVLVLQKPSRNHQFSQEKVPKNQQFYSRLFDGFFEIFENCGYISDSVLRFWDPTPWILSMPFPLLLPFFSLLKLCLPIIHNPKTLNPFLALQLFFLLHVHSVPFSAYTLLASTCLFLWFLQLCVCVYSMTLFTKTFPSCSLHVLFSQKHSSLCWALHP
jgi:hypothetical protein